MLSAHWFRACIHSSQKCIYLESLTVVPADLRIYDLGHSLDLKQKSLATELGGCKKRYLDLGHGTSYLGLFVQNWLCF